LEILAKNIDLNNLQNNITILPIALNDKSKISELNLSDFKWGAAHSVFEKKFGWDGKDINTALSYRTLGFSIDDVSKYLKMLPPDYIKVDVDGIENLVLSGGVNTIDKAKSVLIEITKNFQSQSLGVKNILENLDFQLINEFKTSEYSYNQIWNKKI
jgi:FkbM family methyltransferase